MYICNFYFVGNDTLTNDINNAPIIIADTNGTDDFVHFTHEFKKIMADVQLQLQNITNKEEQLQETANMILAKINSDQYHKEDTIKDNKIGKYLPLGTIEKFLELEALLKNDDEALTQVVSKFVYQLSVIY